MEVKEEATRKVVTFSVKKEKKLSICSIIRWSSSVQVGNPEHGIL